MIPAHNEQSVIYETLARLLRDAQPGEFAIVVVANGCTDETASEARRAAVDHGHSIHVLELAVAGKANAIRAGEALVSIMPRLFLDADVECSAAVARLLANAVGSRFELAVPKRVLELRDVGLIARLYYRGWQRLPWVSEQLAGRGAYVLSEAGRERLGEFPDVIAEDRWVTNGIPRELALVCMGAPVVVRPPRTVHELLAVRARVYRGNADLGVSAHDWTRRRRIAALVRALNSPRAGLEVGVFIAMTTLAKLRSARMASATWNQATRHGA